MKIYFLRFLRKVKVLQFLNLCFSVLVNDRLIKIPIVGGVGFGNLDMSEKWMITVMEKLSFPEDSSFVDVGVNIGQTLIKLRSVYPKIEYIGFEPNPECVYYTQKLIDRNEWKKTTLIPSGIAGNTGIIELNYYFDDPTDSSASIVPDFRGNDSVVRKSFITCSSATDVNFLFTGKTISAIKIDVEGAELEVIRGLQDFLKQHRPHMLVEILPVYQSDNTVRLNPQLEIEQLLDDLGYTKYRIHKDANGELSHLESIESIGVHDRLDWCDYLFSPMQLDNG